MTDTGATLVVGRGNLTIARRRSRSAAAGGTRASPHTTATRSRADTPPNGIAMNSRGLISGRYYGVGRDRLTSSVIQPYTLRTS